MTSRTAWVLDRLPWLAARKAHGRDGHCEVVTLSSWKAFPVDVRRGHTVEVRCLSGELLVTFEGDLEDHIVGPGQSFVVRGYGRLVVAALRPGQVAFRVIKGAPAERGEDTGRACPPALAPRLGPSA